MKKTLRQCVEEMHQCLEDIYQEALVDVRKKLETEALTEPELYTILRKYVEGSLGDYTSYELFCQAQFFCQDSPIYDEFFELVKKLPGVKVKDFEISAVLSEGSKAPVEVRLYGYQKHIKNKIEKLKKGDPYQLLKQQPLRY